MFTQDEGQAYCDKINEVQEAVYEKGQKAKQFQELGVATIQIRYLLYRYEVKDLFHQKVSTQQRYLEIYKLLSDLAEYLQFIKS